MHPVAHEILQQAIRGDWSRFDLAACCYRMLLQAISNQSVFLSTYFMDGGTSSSNPNLMLIRGKKYEYAKMLGGHDGMLINSVEAYGLLLKDMNELELAPFEDGSMNELTLLWLLVMAIDLSCVETNKLRSEELEFPLNQIHLDEVGVYFASYTGFVGEHFAMSSIESIPELTFNGQLDTLLFLQAQGRLSYPNLVTAPQWRKPSVALARRDQLSAASSQRDSVRIGIELFSGAYLADWEGNGTPISFVCTGGASFVASYSTDYPELFRELVKESVDHAVASGCDILIFPEYVISPELASIISAYLCTLDDCNALKLVVAGSGWIDDPDGMGGDNVSVLYAGSGRQLGRVFKWDPFIGRQTIGGTEYRRVEQLAHPGKEITVVDVPGLGRVVTAICRDVVSNERLSLNLARDLRADIVCVPAFSASLDKGFRAHLDLLSEKNLSVSCVCNLCCSRAIRDGEDSVAVSLVAYPVPKPGNPKLAQATREEISKFSACSHECTRSFRDERPHSCLWVATIEGCGKQEHSQPTGLSVRVESLSHFA